MIIQFLVSLAATLSFAVLFSAEKKQLFFCGLTGALGWIVYLICLQYTSYYFIMGDMSRFSQYGISTVKVAGSIVLGIIFGFALPQSLFNGLSKLVHKD